MSYIVLARKYRPRNFSEMVGQEHVVQAMTNALTSRRLHHAYLFTGTRGVGKTSVARILAKSLNCQGADGQGDITATPCGVCPACRDIDAGRFVDYTELDAASNRGVDDVQMLLEQAVYKPVQGRFKVFMIDEVHMLTGHAFNAMLKTLEEPPEYLKFVLATTDPQKVPVTVLSRCLQFNLRPMAPEVVLGHLSHVLQAENVAFEPPALRLLARAARGSMRDALSLTDQAIAFGSGSLQEETVRQMLGSVDRSHVFRLIDALADGDGRTVVEICDALRLNGLNAASTLEEMTGVLQRMAVHQAVPDMVIDANDPDAGEIARLAAAMPADETQLLYSLCLHGRGELGLAPDEYAALNMVLLRLLAFKPAAAGGGQEKKTLKSGAEAPQRVSQGGALAAPAPVSAPAPAPEPSPAPSPARTPAPVREAPRVDSPSTPAAVPPAAVVVDAAPAVPQVQRLPVREGGAPPRNGSFKENPTQSSVNPTDDATRLVAIPVRHLQGPGHADEAIQATSPEVARTGDGDFWHEVVSELIAREAINALVRELALQSQLVARDDADWLLRVERESLNQPQARERLLQALRGAGHEVRLSVEVGRVTDSPARRNAAAAAEKLRAAEAMIQADPFVQAMMHDFGAKIVPGSVKPL
ncbi:MAG: DNA polymerase III subunit gamma/tau [Burkholderiaceae bacterium]|nr:DNA polymerase III subunit gamma/tau [Burkholderiaceae bacterium]